MLRTIYCPSSSNFLKKTIRLKRGINCWTVHHRYLHSPIEKETHQRDHSSIIQWFASDIHRKSISIPPSTNITRSRFPPDAYPINLTDRNAFQIEASTTIIMPTPEDYMQSMPNWISKFISNFTINPLSETLVHHIQQYNPLYIYQQTRR